MNRNKMVLIILAVIALVGLSAFLFISSGSSDSEKTAEAFLRKYYTVTLEENERLTIQDDSAMGPEGALENYIKEIKNEYQELLTDKALEALAANRAINGLNMLARDIADNISIDKLTITIREDDGDEVLYDYSVDISITLKEDKEVINTTKRGVIKVVKVDSQWLIDYADIDYNILKDIQ